MKYCLGKTPARPNAVKFRFEMYFDETVLPEPPLRIGHELIGHKWGMLANDKVGCCVWSGAAHEHMIWTHMGRASAGVDFTDRNVLTDYGAATGYDGTRETDNGSDMADAAAYRRKTGIMDSNGVRHRVDAYVSLSPGDVKDLAMATYIMGAVGVGVRFPSSAMMQFDHRIPWTIVRGDTLVGGHYIPCIGRNTKGDFLIISWGRIHAMTPEWYQEYNDETLGYVSIEVLRGQLSPEGFDAAGLLNGLKDLSG